MTENEADKKLAAGAPEFHPAPTPEVAPQSEKMPTSAEQGRAEPELKTPDAPPSESTLKFRLPSLRKPKPVLPPIKDDLALKIEKVMEEDVAEAYQRLSPIAKQEFKLRGEETAAKIREMIASGHVKAKKIFRLILDWLKMLPGINRFFLEQEAKIKTDKIILMNSKEKNVPS